MERSPYELMVVGLGAVYQEHLAKPLSSWIDPNRHILVDREYSRFAGIDLGRRVIADINQPPFTTVYFSGRPTVAVIATPEHLTPLMALQDLGIQRFIVEKPLVNNSSEADVIRNMTSVNKGLKIYALEMCITKVLPLYLLTGMINPDDPRWEWVEDQNGRTPAGNLYNSLEEQIGELEGIESTVLEGGNFGIPDLAIRPWLETDSLRGGMLLDLGTHVLGPLIAAGLIDSPDSVQVDLAKRYVLGEDRRSFVSAAPGQPEMYVDALLGVQYKNRNIPLSVRLAKTFHQGGIWKLIIRGSKGDISIGLRAGQKLTIESNNGNNLSLELRRENGVYPLSLAEADLFFMNHPNFDGNQKALLDSIAIIDKIKQRSYQ